MISKAHDMELLGGILGNQKLIDDYLITKDYFTIGKTKKMFEIIRKINSSGETVDLIRLADESPGLVSEFASLNQLCRNNFEYYVTKQQEHVKLEKIRRLSLKINDLLKDKTPDEIIESIDKEITGMDMSGANSLHKLSDCMYPAIERIEKYYKSGGELSGVSSGYQCIDKITNGFNDGDMIVIGARASMGKTSLAINMAARIIKKNIPAGFFSCEMSKELLIDRIISAEASLNMNSVRSGNMRPADFHNITAAMSNVFERDFYIDDTPNIDIMKLKSQARVMCRKGVKIIFIDYLTLIKGYGNVPKVERVGQISKDTKQLARELKIPIIILSQITRGAEGKRPTLADLRWSGEIEEDADIVFLIHRQRGEEDTELIIAKNRNGACLDIKLHYNLECMRFDEYTNTI